MSRQSSPESPSADHSHRTRQPGWLRFRGHMLALVMLASLAITSAQATGATHTSTVAPALSSTSIDSVFGGTAVVLGTNFTPGGNVLIEVSGRGETHQTRLVTASADTLASNASSDPALGFHPGGVVNEVFVRLCEHPVSVRAFDVQAGTWSNLLDLDTGCAGD